MNYYSIEKHLAEVCIENKEFEILNSIWNLNKKNLTNALSHVSFNFPHYSIHDGSHAKTIISNIESFLGEDRIKKLEPTDAFLILMSAYTHDIGMVVIHKSIEESLHNNVLDVFLEDTATQNFDKDLAKAAKLLLDVKNKKLPPENTIFDIRKSIVLIVAEFYRKNHYIRSQAVLSGKDKEFKELLSNFYSDLIPNRILTVLGDIAYSHGVSFDFLIDNLQKESNGISKDKIHPRFISALLRLGDLLDVDDKRFNPISEKLISESLPEISEKHKIKHASVRHLLIKDTSIEVIVDCPEQASYRIARQWFDWVEKEVEDQNKYWNELVPDYFEGYPPTIKKNGIKVLFNSNQPDNELLNLRFAIRSEKAIEMFEGKGIYDDSSFVFIRELIQNGIDATKIQLWKDIFNGNYNDLIYNHIKEKYENLEIVEDVYKYIKFPDDIPIEVYRQYQVSLYVDWKDEIDGDIKVKVVDKGSGINREDLLRMTKFVGDSRSKDNNYSELKKTLPYWLKPTGAFGIGLQSVFLVVDSFTMLTKAENNVGYEIIFNSSKNNEYSYINKEVNNIPRGTTVEVIIPKEKFGVAFGTSWSHNVLGEYDYFSTDESQYFGKIEEYLRKNFSSIEELNIYISNRNILKSLYSMDASSFLAPIISNTDEENKIKVTAVKMPDGELRFWIDEGIEIGSQITLQILDNFNSVKLDFNYSSMKFNSVYKVRDIPINEEDSIHYMVSPYFSIQWNLLNPESDKILNLARNKFIREVRHNHENIFVEKILPKILNMLWKMLVLDKSNQVKFEDAGITKETLKVSIFHLYVTAKLFDINYSLPTDIFEGLQFPKNLAIKTNSDAVSVIEFLNAKTYATLDNHTVQKSLIETNLEKLKPFIIDKCKDDVEICTFSTHYFWYMSEHKKLTKIIDVPNDDTVKNLGVYIFSNNLDSNIIVSDENRRKILTGIMDKNRFSKERNRIIPIEPYSTVLSVKKERYQIISYYSTYLGQQNYIISPFNDEEVIKEVIQIFENEDSEDKDYLSGIIRKHKILNKLIPNKLTSWIINNSSNDSNDINIEMILNSYSDMIAESYLLNKSKGIESKS